MSEGILIGENVLEPVQQVYLPETALHFHHFYIDRTGAGSLSLMLNMVSHRFQEKLNPVDRDPLILVDPAGSLNDAALDLIPDSVWQTSRSVNLGSEWSVSWKQAEAEIFQIVLEGGVLFIGGKSQDGPSGIFTLFTALSAVHRALKTLERGDLGNSRRALLMINNIQDVSGVDFGYLTANYQALRTSLFLTARDLSYLDHPFSGSGPPDWEVIAENSGCLTVFENNALFHDISIMGRLASKFGLDEDFRDLDQRLGMLSGNECLLFLKGLESPLDQTPLTVKVFPATPGQ